MIATCRGMVIGLTRRMLWSFQIWLSFYVLSFLVSSWGMQVVLGRHNTWKWLHLVINFHWERGDQDRDRVCVHQLLQNVLCSILVKHTLNCLHVLTQTEFIITTLI